MSLEIKAVELESKFAGKIVEVRVTGKLEDEDYDVFVPELERTIERHGKIRILLTLLDFKGWTVSALWQDLKFDVKHFNDIERLAIVGDKKWEKGMAAFCKPFTTAKVRYFDISEADAAQQWIREGLV